MTLNRRIGRLFILDWRSFSIAIVVWYATGIVPPCGERGIEGVGRAEGRRPQTALDGG